MLETIKGKCLLSSYRNKSLEGFIERNGRHSIELRMKLSMTGRYEYQDKIEVLTANYPITRDMIQDLKEPEPESEGE